ncbi:hypothetical protein NW754_014284 [Fusarium falciforme]|nr:hypothetical protein NW754_014284 [Fusarium falciforme]
MERPKSSRRREEKDESGPDVWGERWEHARLRLVNVASHETKTLVEGDRHIAELAWSPDGKSVAFFSIANTNIEEAMLTGTTISIVNVETGAVRDLCKVPNELNYLILGARRLHLLHHRNT